MTVTSCIKKKRTNVHCEVHCKPRINTATVKRLQLTREYNELSAQT